MKRIFKYKLPRDGELICIDAHVVKWLTIQEQNGWPHIWAIVDDDVKGYQKWNIIAWGTGWDVPEELMTATYLGTAQDGAGYVWHYFGEIAASDYATATTELEYNPYDYTLETKINYNVEELQKSFFLMPKELVVRQLTTQLYKNKWKS